MQKKFLLFCNERKFIVIIILFLILVSRTLKSNLVSSIHILEYVVLHISYKKVLFNKTELKVTQKS